LHLILDLLKVEMVLVELGEDFANVVDHQLRQFSVVVLYNKAKEFAEIIINDVSDLFAEREWG
jgi:hypothetical protein